MKPLSNTAIAAIFAIVLTLVVAGLLCIPIFRDLEGQIGDQMLLVRYDLEKSLGHHHADSQLVLAAIDDSSLQSIGAWPFPRDVHGQFLQLLATEKPKVVGWDVLFVEAKSAPVIQPQEAPAPVTPPAAPEAPAAHPAPATPTPEPTPAPASPETPSATPTPSPSVFPTPTPSAATQGRFHFSVGQNLDTHAAPATSPPAPEPAPVTTKMTAPAVDATPAPASAPSPPATNTPADASTAPATPETAAPAMTAPQPAPPPTEAVPAPQPQAPPPSEDDLLLEGVHLFPNMVTASALSPDGLVLAPEGATPQEGELQDKELLPTLPIPARNITGDISKLHSETHALLPFPALREASYFGFVNQEAETGGGTRRTIQLLVNYSGRVFPSFDIQMLIQYWNIKPEQIMITLGKEMTLPRPDGTPLHIPIDQTGTMTINYRDRIEDFQNMGYAAMLTAINDKLVDKKSRALEYYSKIKLQDHMVVIGVTSIGTDAGPTPLDKVAPLVTTHLNAINNILQQDYLTPVSQLIWLPVYGLFIFGLGNVMLRVGILPMIPIGFGALFLLAGIAFAALWLGNYLVPVAIPEIGLLLLTGAIPTKRFFGEEREKIRVRSAMRAYLSEKVMAKVLAHPDNVKLGGVKQVITIMFCDIRGFTKYCDDRDSQEVLTVLNEYMEEMTQVVFKYDGTVDKYIGDCIMAFWNAPDLQADHAQRAVCCAMEMRYALANFKTKRAGLDTELFECGIGIHTGEALVGNMGSSLKLNYTAMGSTVNMAARLETLTKRLNERILISQDTLNELQGDFPITDRGEATVPGFAKPIHVYAVGADVDIRSALSVGRTIAGKQEYTAEEVSEPIWKPAPLPSDADPNP